MSPDSLSILFGRSVPMMWVPWFVIPLFVLTVLLVTALLVLLRSGRGQDRLVEALAAGFQKSLGELTDKLGLLAAETQVIARQQESLRGQAQDTERGLQSLETKMVETTAVARSGLAQTLAQVQESLQTNLVSAQTSTTSPNGRAPGRRQRGKPSSR